MSELPQPRASVIFIKGDFTRRGDRRLARHAGGSPAARAATGSRPNRLDLARWLVEPAHPLTARVIVNRVWQQYFGRGLVETENDFGTQGLPPTHPELLDWLAVELVAQSWSLKAMHRLIVTSSTYRQSSDARPDLRDRRSAQQAPRSPVAPAPRRRDRARRGAERERAARAADRRPAASFRRSPTA